MRRIMIAGCGFVGSRLADKELQNSSSVSAFVKSTESANKLEKRGIDVSIIDLDSSHFSLSQQNTVFDCLYYFIAPQAMGKTDRRSRNFIANYLLRLRVQRLVLISTTGVYGDCNGNWIDEMSALNPQTDRAFRRVDAEKQWRRWSESAGVPLAILRVAGLYGPGKLPLERIRRADPVLLEEQSPWSNRIYSKDLIDVCFRMGDCDIAGIFNAVDGHPTTMTDYFLKLADLFELAPPIQISMQQAERRLGKGIMSYLKESKRIRNNHLCQTLGIKLKYPTLDQGIADISQELVSTESSEVNI